MCRRCCARPCAAVPECNSTAALHLDPRIKGCLRLDTLIHEFTHHHLDNKLRPLLKHLQKSFGTKKALEIEEALIGDHSTALADFLWKNNVRIIDQP